MKFKKILARTITIAAIFAMTAIPAVSSAETSETPGNSFSGKSCTGANAYDTYTYCSQTNGTWQYTLWNNNEYRSPYYCNYWGCQPDYTYPQYGMNCPNCPNWNCSDTSRPNANCPNWDCPETGTETPDSGSSNPGTETPDTNAPDTETPDIDSSNPGTETPDTGKPGTETPDSGSSNPGIESGSASGYTGAVAELVNEQRAANGLTALSYNTKVAEQAQKKAEDMAANGYFSHTSPTYGSAFDMLSAANISYRSAGENIAKGQTSPTVVMNSWMNSSGHKANILNSSYSSIGVGYAKDAAGTAYWVQIFVG